MTFWERFSVLICNRVGSREFAEEFWSYTPRCVLQFNKRNDIIDAVGTTEL